MKFYLNWQNQPSIFKAYKNNIIYVAIKYEESITSKTFYNF